MSEIEKFWIKLLGHEFVGCVRLMESLRIVKGGYDMLAWQLFCRDKIEYILHLMAVTESCLVVYESKRPVKIEVKYLQSLRDPTWQSIFPVLAFVIDHFPKAVLKMIRWDEIAKYLDERSFQTGVSLRLGTGFATTFEILIPTSTASKSHVSEPVILLNGNQRLKFNEKSNFEIQTVSGRGTELECIFSHRFGEKTKELPDVGLTPILPQRIIEQPLHWNQKPVAQWNANDVSNWITDEFQKKYKIPAPWNAAGLMREGILQGGVHQLGRMQNAKSEDMMENYKKFIEWLLNHPKYSLTSSVIFSAKMMELFIVDQAHKKSSENLNAFNQSY